MIATVFSGLLSTLVPKSPIWELNLNDLEPVDKPRILDIAAQILTLPILDTLQKKTLLVSRYSH